MNLNNSANLDAKLLLDLMDHVNASIVLLAPIFDEDGKEIIDFTIAVANKTFAAYKGATKEQITGDPTSKWFAGYKENGLFDIYKNAFKTQEPIQFEFHYNTDDISAWLDIRCKRTGEFLSVTGTDHTSLKSLQNELEQTVAEMQRSNNRLEEFAFVASHDLQEPLRKINAFGSMIKDGYEKALDVRGAELLTRMLNATKRMNTLIEDLLTYSRINTHTGEDMENVNLESVIEEVLTDLEASITEQDASISIDTLPEVKGNAMQLRQLFQNLLGNAMKFARKEVPIEIVVESRIITGLPNSGKPEHLRKSQQYHEVTFTDNGIGFEPQYAERIFQVFQRLHGKTEYPGSGVGLSIARSVMESHGGIITAEGRPGAGATFSVYFPVAMSHTK